MWFKTFEGSRDGMLIWSIWHSAKGDERLAKVLHDKTQRSLEDEADCRSLLLLQTVVRGRTFTASDCFEGKKHSVKLY